MSRNHALKRARRASVAGDRKEAASLSVFVAALRSEGRRRIRWILFSSLARSSTSICTRRVGVETHTCALTANRYSDSVEPDNRAKNYETLHKSDRWQTFPTPRFYVNRTFGGHRHYCYSGRPAVAGVGQSQDQSPGHLLHVEHQAARARMDHVLRRLQRPRREQLWRHGNPNFKGRDRFRRRIPALDSQRHGLVAK